MQTRTYLFNVNLESQSSSRISRYGRFTTVLTSGLNDLPLDYGLKKSHHFCYLTVDGGWSPWKPFSACSATCGKAFHTSTRLCNKPAPLNGGKPCVGNATDTQLCRDLPLCASKCSVWTYRELVSCFVWVFQLTNNNFTKQG